MENEPRSDSASHQSKKTRCNIIIIEGCDSSGKTTLARQIAAEFKLEYWKREGPALPTYDTWMHLLSDGPEARAELVCDRFFFSELVFGPLKRGGLCITTHQREVIESLLLRDNLLIIQAHLIHDEGLFANRPQMFDWNTALQSEELFTEVLRPWSPTNYSWCAADGDRQLDFVRQKVRDYLDFKRSDQSQQIFSYGRGQIYAPNLMIVGEKFSTDNRWKVPFERSRSAVALHAALRGWRSNWTSVTYLTNAFKTDSGMTEENFGRLEAEIEQSKPKIIIAVGSKALGALRMIGERPAHIRHPGYWIRKDPKNIQTHVETELHEILKNNLLEKTS